MTTFVLGAAALLLLAAALLRPAWRPGPAAPAGGAAHLGLLADRLAALDRERDAEGTDPAAWRAARTELERRVLDESVDAPTLRGDDAAARRLRFSAALAVPILAIALYATLGNTAALDAGPAPEPEVTTEAIDAMLATLARRLETPSADPASDAKGWTMLARSYAALRRDADADRAYARAIALAPADASLVADRADVLGLLQGGRLAGEPERLALEALRLDPRQPKALALAGTAAYERGDRAEARRRWQAARAVEPAGSEFANGLDRSLAEIGADASVAEATPAPTSAAPAAVTGRATLAPALAGRVAPNDTVFVVARAAEGPRMPLAVVRRTVADLPFDFTLDDHLAMQPALKLSAFERVVVEVRVSRSGEAMPRSGDLRGRSAVVANRSGGLVLAIDSVEP